MAKLSEERRAELRAQREAREAANAAEAAKPITAGDSVRNQISLVHTGRVIEEIDAERVRVYWPRGGMKIERRDEIVRTGRRS